MPVKITPAAAASSGGATKIWEVDWSGVGAADWTTGGPGFSVAPSAGSNTSNVTWTVGNQGTFSTAGPNGTTGLDLHIGGSTASLWWASTDTAPYVSATLADLVGATPKRTALYVCEIDFTATPNQNFDAIGIGLIDSGSTGWGLRQRQNGANEELVMQSWTSAASVSHGIVTNNNTVVTLQLATWGGRASWYAYDTSTPGGTFSWLTQLDATKDRGHLPNSAATPGSTAENFDITDATLRIFAETQGGAAAFQPVVSRFTLWEIAPS